MGWLQNSRDRVRIKNTPLSEMLPSDPASMRAATAKALGRDADLSYITAEYAARGDEPVEHGTDIGKVFQGAEGETIISSYGGKPLQTQNHLAVFYGHRASRFRSDWRWFLVEYADDVWTPLPTFVRGMATSTDVVGTCSDGSLLWEFRL